MIRPQHLLLLILILSSGAYAGNVSISLGKQLYQQGLDADGQPITGIVYSDVPMQGKFLACMQCHRRSGYGSSESRTVVPAITGEILFNRQSIGFTRDYHNGNLGNTQRPAYTLETFTRALRYGVGANGQTLSSTMPRYTLKDHEIRALASYLNSISNTKTPGVTETEIHIATIITPEASEDEERALIDVLDKYTKRKNSETRLETARAATPPFQRAWSFNAYRKWVLHVWKLVGPPAQWQTQLERYYQQQPVFAVVSGLGGHDWQPIHNFCESQQMPCLLPHLSIAPAVLSDDFYSLYISQGLSLEAQAVASDIARSSSVRVLQLHHSATNTPPTSALRRYLAARADISLVDLDITDQLANNPSALQQAVERISPDIIVAWFDQHDIQLLDALGSLKTPPSSLYLSTTLLPDTNRLTEHPLYSRIKLVHPYLLPTQQNQLKRFEQWARLDGVTLTHPRLQSDAYFAISLAGEALMHIRGNFSREYFMERIEHMTDNMINTSNYPAISLAPGQRFIVKGAYLWPLQGGPQQASWLVP